MARKLKGKAGSKSLKAALRGHQADALKKQLSKKKEQHKLQQKSQPSALVKKNQELQKEAQAKFVPFEKEETLLLVGEGDFSFARSLIEEGFILPRNLIATSYDNSPSELKLKYPHSFEENYEFLIGEKVAVFFNIDATNLIKTFKLSKKTSWSKLLGPEWGLKSLKNIMFNFPHTGKGIKDQDRNIRDHQELVFGYFRSSKKLFELVNLPILRAQSQYSRGYSMDETKDDSSITPEGYGKILLSVFDGEPYDSWMTKSLAKDNGLHVRRSNRFQWELYPTYNHKRTNSEQDTTKPAQQREARIYIFQKFERPRPNARKVKNEES